MKRCFFYFSSLLLSFIWASAQDLMVSDFSGTDLANNRPVSATSLLSGGLTISSGWDFGTGLTAVNDIDNALAFSVQSSAAPSSLADAIAEDEYLSLTLTPSSAVDLAGQRITFGITRVSYHAATQYSVATSVEGFDSSSVLFTSAAIANGDYTEASFSFILPTTSDYQGLTTPVEIRIYAHGASYNGHVSSLSAFSITDPGQVYTLATTASDGGSVSVQPDGQVFEAGTSITLTAEPPVGYRFERWQGDLSTPLNFQTITLDSDTAVHAVFSSEPTPDSMQVGTNLSAISSWMMSQPFTDVMKYARIWVGESAGNPSTQDVPAGAQGYPLQIPYTDDGGVTYYRARSILPHYQAGVYQLSFEGTGTVSFRPQDSSSDTYSASGPRVTYPVTFTEPSGLGANTFIYITASDPADPVRNISLHLPGYTRDGPTFQAEWLRTLEGFGTLRYMDWGRTNSSPVTTWATRRAPDYYTQGVTVQDSYGTAIEHMIELANLTDKDPWICIPHLADDDYVTQAARLIRDTLEAGRKVYLEYSNETWNSAPAFIQTYYCRQRGTELNLSTNEVEAGHLFHSMRSAQIWQIFADEFGSDMETRVVKVMASWSANDAVSDLRMRALADPAINSTGIAADALAIAPYFGHGIQPEEVEANGYPTVDELVTTDALAELVDKRGDVQRQKAIARRAGVSLICYEGGQHYVGAGSLENDATMLNLLQTANRDPRMGQRYSEYLTMLQEEGIELFANFLHIEAWSQYGSWGVWEYQNQPLAEAPKGAAILDWLGVVQSVGSLRAPDSITSYSELGEVTLAWSEVTAATSYTIYRGTTADFASAQSIGTATATHYTDSSVDSGVEYHYWIGATAGATTETMSSPLTVNATVDDLAELSDEFDDAATLSNWSRLNDTEGWNADKLEVHDVDTSVEGQMRIMPHTTSWYADLTGPLVYKEVTGDFVVTTQLDIRRRNDAAGRPVPQFSLGGIMIRSPRSTTAAAPNPAAAPGTVLPWPPSGYTTDWQPDTENYIFLSYGNAVGNTAADQWAFEVKTTVNGNSNLYYDATGVPAGESLVTLQAVRRGNTFLLLRKHGESGQWIIENRYTRNDMPATLQVGITTYTDWNNITANGMFAGNSDHDGQYHHNRVVMTAANGFTVNPDLVVDAEYFRFARPPASLTEAALNAAPLTSSGSGLQYLAASDLADLLGDTDPAGPVEPSSSLEAYLASYGLSGADASATADPDGDTRTNIQEWATATDPTASDSSDWLQHSFREEGGETYLALSYPRLVGGSETANQYSVGDLVYQIDGSLDLENWDQIPVAMAADTTSLATLPSGYEWGCVRLPVSVDVADRGFLRFDVQ